MRRLLLVSLAALIVLGAVAFGALGLGYFSHRERIDPVYGLAERAITKGRRVLEMPTETHAQTDFVRTTYLTMRGQVYLMPGNDFKTGGALTLWGDDVIVLNSGGRIFYLDEERGLSDGLVETGLAVPPNRLGEYLDLAAAEYPDQIAKPDALRYNDIEFVDDPAFRGLLLSYTYIDIENRCYRNRISRASIPDGGVSIRDLELSEDDWEVLYDSDPCLEFNDNRELIVGYMAGGRIAYKAPGLLYLGNGEYHREGLYRPDAGIQSPDSDYGKTIEIDLATGESRHYSIGHRNLQGVTVDGQGRLWTTEHGMRGGDELNLIVDGENYGWPLENLGTLYSGVPAPSEGGVGRHEIYKAPVYAWLPSAAVSSLAVVDGFHEAWDGDLLIGSLRGKTLFRARIDGERLMFLESIPIGQRIRDVMQVSEETIALWLDTNELVMLRIVPQTDPLEGLVAGLVETGLDADLAQTAHGILTGCNECHSYEENVHAAGPSLYGVAGRGIASTAFAGYSSALRARAGEVWDEAALTAYLADPEGFAPGTAMSGLGVGSPELAAAVARAFAWLGSDIVTAEER